MAMSVGAQEDEAVISTINTTPLVDVMLVLLIIFLITIPVVITTVKVELPKASNIATVTKPENIVIAIDADGNVYWNAVQVAGQAELMDKLSQVAVLDPQPEVHIRGDKAARYEFVGRVVVACQRVGIVKVGFITEPLRPGLV
ncbi:biopolymer transporter ExbD [Emcibacter sp. SYSU 3D8]|uniref:ExbD/TolR family protein n=1 Tax=Emcibacter sp. SYSU 3D8 TaxID=3133969 RepID=UPI0031FE79DC